MLAVVEHSIHEYTISIAFSIPQKENWLLNSTFNSIITDQFRFAIKMVLETGALHGVQYTHIKHSEKYEKIQ